MSIPHTDYITLDRRLARRGRRLRIAVAVGVAAVLFAVERPTVVREGASGREYPVFSERVVWQHDGPTLTLRFRSDSRTRSSARGEATDLLPVAAARAEALGLDRVIIKANRPLVAAPRGPAVYREFRFRFHRDGSGWRPGSGVPDERVATGSI